MSHARSTESSTQSTVFYTARESLSTVDNTTENNDNAPGPVVKKNEQEEEEKAPTHHNRPDPHEYSHIKTKDIEAGGSIEEITKKTIQDMAMKAPSLRTPFMMLLLLINEILTVLSLIFILRWLVNYRGGIKLSEAFWPRHPREAKHNVNLHGAAMSFLFTFIRPQHPIVRIFFEDFQEKTRTGMQLVLNMVGFVAFVLGIQQIAVLEHPKHLPERLEGPDLGIHLIMSCAAIAIYLISLGNFMLHTLNFYYGEVKHALVVGYFVELFLNSHVVETLGHLLDLAAFLSLLTGFLDYIILLFEAGNLDLRHIFTNPISADQPDTLPEEDAYMLMLVTVTFMYLTSVCIIFYKHNILWHNGIITYQMYKNNFKEIADALLRAKDQQEAIQEVMDIECLCRYENQGDMGTRRNVTRRPSQQKLREKQQVAAMDKETDIQKSLVTTTYAKSNLLPENQSAF